MFCNKCGNNLQDTATFCGKCGNKLNAVSSAQSASVISPDKRAIPKLTIIVIAVIAAILLAVLLIIPALSGSRRQASTGSANTTGSQSTAPTYDELSPEAKSIVDILEGRK